MPSLFRKDDGYVHVHIFTSDTLDYFRIRYLIQQLEETDDEILFRKLRLIVTTGPDLHWGTSTRTP